MRPRFLLQAVISTPILLTLLTGCGSKSTATNEVNQNTVQNQTMQNPPSGKSGTPNGLNQPFLDQKKQVPAGAEWSRDILSKNGGAVKFRVTSQGPFSILIVTGKAYQAMHAGNPKIDKKDLLLDIDSKEPIFEKTVTLPAGSFYFIIENQMKQPAEIHLQCWGG